MIAVVIATAMSGAFFHNQTGRDRFEAHFTATQAAYAHAAGAILAAEGMVGLESWLRQLRGPGGLPGRQIVFDADGKILFGGQSAKDLGALLADADPHLAARVPLDRVFAEPIFRPDGQHYWFVSDLRRGRAGGRPPRFANRGPHSFPILLAIIGVAVFVSGIVCYTLAHYLTRPIRQMQTATKQIAAGDFAARVNAHRSPRSDELGELSRDFDVMAEKLAGLQRAQAALVRDVSHELRSPLARLQVALGLAEQRDDGRSTAELKRIEREVAVLDELVAQLLSVARLEAAEQTVEREYIDINALLSAICTDANYEGNEQNKRVRLQTTDALFVRGDLSLLRSAFENIIRNALRHTTVGSEVTVNSTTDLNDAIIVYVRDAGPGVPEAKLEDLFKPFVRVESARDRDSGGFGLGLAIASSAIHRHQGQIKARNHPQGGLEVSVTLPRVDNQGGVD